MSDGGWAFTIEEAFDVPGRGTGVVGELHGEIATSGKPAHLLVGDAETFVERVYVEVVRVTGGKERLALMLYGVTKDDVPAGATLVGPVQG